jgi:hypothetical protein
MTLRVAQEIIDRALIEVLVISISERILAGKPIGEDMIAFVDATPTLPWPHKEKP